MKEVNGPRRAKTSYAVGKWSTRRGEVFRDYLLPGGEMARVLDEDIFSEALRRGSRVLEQNAKHFQELNSTPHRPIRSRDDD